jgi:hypothetical protein
LLIEKPNAYIAAQVPISEIGTASAGMSVADTFRKNRKITMITRQTAIASVSCTSNTAARIDVERSNRGCISIPGGTWARIAGSFSRTRSTTSTVLASGCRWIASTIARESLNQLATRSFSTLSMTRATWLSLIGAPLR